MENLSRRGFVGTCCACSSVSFGWEIVRDSPIINIVSQTMSKQQPGINITWNAPWSSAAKSMLPGNAKCSMTSLGATKHIFRERPSYLRSDFVTYDVMLALWFPHVCFEVFVLPFRSSTASVWKGCFIVSLRSSLLAHQEGPFSGCYWVTSLEWPWIEWHSWRDNTNKQIKLKWTAAPFNNFFKYWREYKK